MHLIICTTKLQRSLYKNVLIILNNDKNVFFYKIHTMLNFKILETSKKVNVILTFINYNEGIHIEYFNIIKVPNNQTLHSHFVKYVTLHIELSSLYNLCQCVCQMQFSYHYIFNFLLKNTTLSHTTCYFPLYKFMKEITFYERITF